MIHIRKENEADYPHVMNIIERESGDVHRNRHISLAEMRSSEFFVPELSLVAEDDERKIAGHIYLIKILTHRIYPSLGIAHIVVAPEYQGLSIVAMMVEKAHQKAKELGYGSVVSLEYKKFLSKLGYYTVANLGIRFPYSVFENQCLIAELHPGALAWYG